MSALRNIVWWVAAVICTGCASFAPPPSSAPGANEGVVFGRMQFIHNGAVLKADDASDMIKAGVINHVSPYTSREAINKNAFAPGQWAIKTATHDGGYFAATLPPGRYYFVEFGFVELIGAGALGVRPYMPILGNTTYVPFLATFDVLPGKATYIGTMKHLAKDANQGWTWNLLIDDEIDDVRPWFAAKFPAWSDAVQKQLVHIDVLTP